MPASKTITSKTTTTRKAKVKALPSKQNGGVGKGGVVTQQVAVDKLLSAGFGV
jgi:hypothetical protein